MDNQVDTKQYETRSLQLAAFLFTRTEVKLVDFNKRDPKNIFFVFSPFEEAEKLEDAYFMDSILVSPKKLMDAFTALKEKVFQIQRNKF